MIHGKTGSLLAAAALAMMAASPAQVSANAPPLSAGRYWAPSSRSGNNRRENSSKRHAKAKAAYKSKRAQRKKAKR